MALERSRAFAELLRAHRRAAGLTQEELAERAGLSARALRKLESGASHTPRRDTVELLAQALQLAGADLTALQAAARSSVPAPAPTLAHAHHPMLRTQQERMPLIGRAHEFSRLERHLDSEGPPLLLLAGEPGIGKTRLLQEAAARAASAGWMVLAGGCTRRSGQEPYSPLPNLLSQFIGTRSSARVRADLEGCTWLVRLLPELAERPGVLAPTWSLSPEQERRLMYAAVGRYLSNVATPVGTLLVLDDLQWAGPDVLHLIGSLLQPIDQLTTSGSAPPVRVLGAYRSTEVHHQDPLGLLVTELAPLGLASQLPLGPLPLGAASQLLDQLLADSEGEHASHASPLARDTTLRDRLLQRAEGVPYFLISCAQALQSGALGEAPKMIVPGGAEQVDAVPWDIAQSIRRRISALTEPAQTLLEIAAVSGRVVQREDLFSIARQAMRDLADEGAAIAALDALTHAILLTESNEHAYTFAHDLIREVVLSELTAARREAWHRRVGEALERLPAGSRRVRAAELAWHFLHGGDGLHALPYTLQAGDQAAEIYAHEEADQHFRGAYALAHELGVPQKEAEALEKRGAILRLLQRDEEAAMVFAQAVEAYRLIGDTEGVWRASGQHAGVLGILGKPEQGRALLQPLIEAADPTQPSKALAAMYLEYSWLFWLLDSLEDRLRVAEQTISVAAAAGDRRIQGEAEFQRGNTFLLMGRVEEALHALERAVPLLEETVHLRRLCSTLNVVGSIHRLRGEFEMARTYSDRALHVALMVGVRSQLRYTWANHGEMAYLLGDWKSAEADFERAVDMSRDDGDTLEAAAVFTELGILRLSAGAVDEGTRLLEHAISLAERRGVTVIDESLPAHAALAEYALVTGRAQDAYERLTAVLEAADPDAFASTLCKPLLAWAALEIGAVNRAEVILAETFRSARTQSNHLALAEAYRVQALVHVACGAWHEADNALGQALALCCPMPYPYAEAKALYVYAQLSVAKGESALAREQLTAARAILTRLGERLYAEYVERLLAALDPSPPGV